jgi:hypothetical protein
VRHKLAPAFFYGESFDEEWLGHDPFYERSKPTKRSVPGSGEST